jgi:hypothetical protein
LERLDVAWARQMKGKLLVCMLLGIGLLAVACRGNAIAPTAVQPDPTAQILIETVVVPETVVVVATPTPTPEQLTPTITPTTAVAQLTATPLPTTPFPTATPRLTATRIPTAVLPTPTTATSPTILYFRANVTIADPGQTIQLEWGSTGAVKATVGHLFDFRMFPDASDLPPSAVFEYTIRPSQRNSITFFLTVSDANDRWAMDSFTLPLTCPDPWFFSPAPDTCPAAPARVSAGAEQRFEHGFMLWEAAERRIYVLFDSGSPRWTVIADTWQDGEAICQIEPVPTGRIHPVRGFGKAWCDEPGLRDRLGWALDHEIGGYQTAVQSTAYDRYNTLYIQAAGGGVWKLLTERSGWEKLAP